MTDPDADKPDLIGRATEEIKAMGSEGMAHPSTKPVMTGAAMGAAAGLLLPGLSIPVGLVGGAAFALWRRINR